MARFENNAYDGDGIFDNQLGAQARRPQTAQFQLPENMEQFMAFVTNGKLQANLLADFCNQCFSMLRQQDRQQLQNGFNMMNNDEVFSDDQVLLQLTLIDALLSKNLDVHAARDITQLLTGKLNALLLRQQQPKETKNKSDAGRAKSNAASTSAAGGAAKRDRNGEQKRLAAKSQCLGDVPHIYFSRMMSVLNGLSKLLVRVNMAAEGILLMESAVSLMQSGAEQLTAPHAFFVFLCYSSANFNRAKDVISAKFIRINNMSNNYDAHYYMMYHYYAGCIMAELEQYKQAMLLFTRAVCTPAGSITQLTVQGLRKLILVSLIEKWKFDLEAQPVAVRSWFQRSRKANATYVQVVRMFTETSNFSRQSFQNYLREHEQEFEADNNLSLIRCCLAARISRQLNMLAAVYDNVPVQTLLDRVQLATLNELLENLHRLKSRHCVLFEYDEQKQVVRFHGLAGGQSPLDNQLATHMSVDAEIAQLTSELFAAQATMIKFEQDVAIDPKFVERVRKTLLALSGGGGGKHMMRCAGGGGMSAFDDDGELAVIGGGFSSGGSRFNNNARRQKRAGGGGASSSGGDSAGFLNGGDFNNHS